jgi:hypothetical protein
MIVVDTSVWVSHLKLGDERLAALLGAGVVVVHPFTEGTGPGVRRPTGRARAPGGLGGRPHRLRRARGTARPADLRHAGDVLRVGPVVTAGPEPAPALQTPSVED